MNSYSNPAFPLNPLLPTFKGLKSKDQRTKSKAQGQSQRLKDKVKGSRTKAKDQRKKSTDFC